MKYSVGEYKVSAIYNDEIHGNPFLEAMPEMLSWNEFKEHLISIPNMPSNPLYMEEEERKQFLMSMYKIFIPIPEFIREQMEEEQHTQEQSHEDALLKEPISIDKVTNYEKRAFLDIDRFLEEMKKEGFQTTIGANGNIIVQSENMSPENRIEITSDNNIIEKANLTTEEEKSLFEELSDSVKEKTDEISTLDLNDMTLKGYENDVEFLNTKESSLFQCDREWLQKLGRLEDNLVALKHNAIPAIQESAKKLLKNSVELRDGIAKPYKAGLLSGVELGGGIESIRDGLKLANIMKNKEKEYENSKKEDSFKALEQKLDLKLTHDEIIKNTNIYTRNTQEFLASRLNDNAVERAFLNTKEEILPLKNRLLWEELELSVKNGKLAEKIPEAERTEEEQSNIIEGNFAKKKIEQNTFIADRLVDSIEKALNNKDLSRNDAIISIAEDYHKAAMGYNVMNGAESITTFDNLSPSEKSDCINIIEKVLDDIPQFDKEFQSREESVPNIEQSAPER